MVEEERGESVREGGGGDLASWSFQAMALRRRMSEASLTRRLNSGSVARVRNVSLRILL